MRGIDYSSGAIPGAVIKAAGFDFVVRYVDDPAVGLNSKHITPNEYHDLVANNVTVFLVFEVDTGDSLGGFPQGVSNAQRARAGRDWIGAPADTPVFFCADRHLAPADIPVSLGYLDGAASVIGHENTGCYGFWEYVDAAIAAGKARWYWQCGIAPDPTDPVHLWQRNDGVTTVGGVSCDINEMLRPITIGGNDLTPDESNKLTQLFNAVFIGGPDAPVTLVNGAKAAEALRHEFLDPGVEPSRITGDTNHTNLRDALMDTVARVSVTKPEVEALNSKVDALATKVDAVASAGSAQAPAVDLDALAVKVAAHLAAAINFKAV